MAKRKGQRKQTRGRKAGRTSAARSPQTARRTRSAKSRAVARTPSKRATGSGRAAARASAARRVRKPASRKPVARKAASRKPRTRPAPALNRDRRMLEEPVPSPPSSLNLDRHPSAARSGRAELVERLGQHTETGPGMTGGDVDGDWESAYSTGDEAPGGDHALPDQQVVEEIGKTIGVQYADNEELRTTDKVEERDRHRWELDPASSEDYPERTKKE